MGERFSINKVQSKKFEQLDVKEGLQEYLSLPRSKDGLHPELADTFEEKIAENPITKESFENNIYKYFSDNFEELLPMLISNIDSSYSPITAESLFKSLNLSNSEIAAFGSDIYLSKIGDDSEYLSRRDDDSYDSKEITRGDILALNWAKSSLRNDSQNEANSVGSVTPNRCYLREEERYLCTNDYGMKVYNKEDGVFEDGQVDKVMPLLDIVGRHFDNLIEILNDNRSFDIESEAHKLIKSKLEMPMRENFDNRGDYTKGFDEYKAAFDKNYNEYIVNGLLEHYKEYPGDKNLILSAIPGRKVLSQLHFHYEKIAKKYAVSGKDPIKDYKDFNTKGHSKLDDLMESPNDEEKDGTTFDFYWSGLHEKPFLASQHTSVQRFLEQAKAGVLDLLASKAAMEDPKINKVFEKNICNRGEQSPFYYSNHKVYDLIKLCGVEKADEILDADDISRFTQLKGFDILKKLGYKFENLESSNIKKQCAEAYKLSEGGVLDYLETREADTIQKSRDSQGKKAEDKHWLELLSEQEAQGLFEEGKMMYWIVQQVYYNNSRYEEGNRFHNDARFVNWDSYDTTELNITKDKLHKYFNDNKEQIVSLLDVDLASYGSIQGQEQEGAVVKLPLILEILKKDLRIKGVGLAYNKKNYLEGVLQGDVGNDLEFALKDWPEDLRAVISETEISTYYDFIDNYITLDIHGLRKYAEWKLTEEGGNWNELFDKDIEAKGDLDFRLCLSKQTEEVRGWYKSAAEYIGGNAMQNYLLRFNSTQTSEGTWADWHDNLYWVTSIQNLTASEATSILNSIQSMDDNISFIRMIPNYRKNRDSLTDQGDIRSLRELQKRVDLIRSNIKLDGLPSEVIGLLSAPGFNISALRDLKDTVRFRDLIDGKLDIEQPFEPHVRTFASRDLVEALKEGLGSRKLKVKGTAQAPGKLFKAINQLVKGRTFGGEKLKGLDLLDNIPLELEQEIIYLLREQNVNIGKTLEARVHAKSDPEGWVCGNYTDCCMPFGGSINNDYMFNPGTQYFTIKSNGRIVAQSVIVDSYDKNDKSDVIVLDNIEVANNFQNLSPSLARAYKVFWTEYTSKPVKIGTGYSDLVPPGAVLGENTIKFKHELEYSDVVDSTIYHLPKIQGLESRDNIPTYSNISQRDSKALAKLESEIYPDGMTHGQEYVSDILSKQRELEVPGAAASFMIRQDDKIVGYALLLPKESDVTLGEEVLHVYDMAILPEFQGKGLAKDMMAKIFDIASAYNMSIETEARASTSYGMMMNDRTRQWFEGKGFKIVKNEKIPEYMDGEDFYFLRLENQQNG